MVIYSLIFEGAVAGYRFSFPRWDRSYDVDKETFLRNYTGDMAAFRMVSGTNKLVLRRIGTRLLTENEDAFSRVFELQDDFEVCNLIRLCQLGGGVDYGSSVMYFSTIGVHSSLQNGVVLLGDVDLTTGKALIEDATSSTHLVSLNNLRSLI